MFLIKCTFHAYVFFVDISYFFHYRKTYLFIKTFCFIGV